MLVRGMCRACVGREHSYQGCSRAGNELGWTCSGAPLPSHQPPPHPRPLLAPSRREQATMAAAEAGLRFDLGGLRSPAERIEAELPATLLSQGALVREPGRLLITHQRLYFQVRCAGAGGAGAGGRRPRRGSGLLGGSQVLPAGPGVCACVC